MIRVSIEVNDETGCFSVLVHAETIRSAVRSVADQYPGYAVKVRFPLDPKMFFVEDASVEAGMVERVAPERVVG
jgi:hypothetical protein